jgi:YfiH family protein
MYKPYFFNLDVTNDNEGNPYFAYFPFIFDGNPIEGIMCGISSRFAGNMKYDSQNQNRLNLFENLGFDSFNVYGLNQIHSRSVLVVDKENPPDVPADGMVTIDRNICLTVTTADCLPVYLYDIKSGAFGLVHSGWKGTGIVKNALSLMNEYWAAKPCDITAVLGPCIDSCCYNVDKERAAAFAKEFGGDSVRKKSGEFFLDMKAANIKLLSEAGVRNIACCRDCTFTDDRLGSFRREGPQFTCMAAVIKVCL